MPELPEVESLARFLDRRLTGRVPERLRLLSVSALKTYQPPLDDLVGRTFLSCRRVGKFLCLELEGDWLVLHLAKAGWVRWLEPLPATAPRSSRGAVALRVEISGGDGFDVTEAGTQKRLALWVVGSPEEVPRVSALGVDPLDPPFDRERLTAILSGQGATLKRVLTDQALIAGVGNAYSDEALHLARLSPFRPARQLGPPEVERLHDALVSTLAQAVEETAERPPKEVKETKRRAMRVHGRTGQACPVCGDVVREVSFADRSLQYCATCQTGGRPLADRRLSRILK